MGLLSWEVPTFWQGMELREEISLSAKLFLVPPAEVTFLLENSFGGLLFMVAPYSWGVLI